MPNRYSAYLKHIQCYIYLTKTGKNIDQGFYPCLSIDSMILFLSPRNILFYKLKVAAYTHL